MPRAKKADSPASPSKAGNGTVTSKAGNGAASLKTGNGGGTLRKRRVTIPAAFSQDAVAQRAYELFMQEGAQHGRDLEHWLRAEQELRKH